MEVRTPNLFYYCVIMFNGRATVASTRPTPANITTSLSTSSSGSSLESSNSPGLAGRDAIWDDSFTFDSLPLDVTEIGLCLFCTAAKTSSSASSIVVNLKKLGSSNGVSHSTSAAAAASKAVQSAFNGKMIDPCLLGSVTIRLDDQLMNRGLCESWYTLNSSHSESSSSSSSSNCSIRVKIRFCQETIHLNERVYQRLSDYLLNERHHKHLCQIYDQIVPSTERAHLVHALLRYYIVKDRILAALKSFISVEILRCADLTTLFRPATLCTSLMVQYMGVR